MATIEIQIHGYRRGHQLLASSTMLSKVDQSVIDRLSDVAGPLRPSERFAPYLTGYPLPGGANYVLARTWQDLVAARAGCVRTVSLIIPTDFWATAQSLDPFLDLLNADGLPEPDIAVSREVVRTPLVRPLPPAPDFRAGELLEVLFLEESKPIAVFDAPTPELILVRLLTAAWAAFRSDFAFSTFARSPRRIEGRFFNLVFAPKDARPKFADWPGRRIDGRADQDARHRWTGTIVRRVFEEPIPKLMTEGDIALIGTDGAETPAALRIALLWDELVAKVGQTPTAALGLLDVANSRNMVSPDALEVLDPAISRAVRDAVETLAPGEAWDFIAALTRKMHGRRLLRGRHALADAIGGLAATAPEGAVVLAGQIDGDGDSLDLLPPIADGLASDHSGRSAIALLASDPRILGRLVASSDGLATLAADDQGVAERMMAVAPSFDEDLLAATRRRLLPHLIDNRHAGLLRTLLAGSGRDALVSEVFRLYSATGLGKQALDDAIIDVARTTGATDAVRDAVASFGPTASVDAMLGKLLKPGSADARWILDQQQFSHDRRQALLLGLVRAASSDELRSMLGDADILRRAFQVIGPVDPSVAKVLGRIIDEVPLDPNVFLELLLQLLPSLQGRRAAELAARGLEIGLGRETGPTRDAVITQLLETAGKELNGKRAFRVALASNVPLQLASRNLVLFDSTSAATRARMLKEPEALAQAIVSRPVFDLLQPGAEAAARLLWDSDSVDHKGFVKASAAILPVVMKERWKPASALIAAAFPPVYRELHRDRLPDFMSFVFPFVDWDRCRLARRELADRFLRSEWRGTDVALAAARAGDVENILRQIAQCDGGPAAITGIDRQIETIPLPWRNQVQHAIAELKRKGDSWFGISLEG